MWRYRDVLPVRPGTSIISLNEGSTPLVKARSGAGHEIHIKDETRNPTGSHKDRALSIGVTKALELGLDTVMHYSDGSTALSSAAYAARAGLRSITVVGGGVPDYRLLPLQVYGSRLLEFQGTAAEALTWVHDTCRRLSIYETSTYRLANPYQAEGPKTIGLEIFEQLGHVPDWLVVPVGGGGTLAGVWQAFVELRSRGLTGKQPRMVGVLPDGFSVLETALTCGLQSECELKELAPREVPFTIQAKIAMTSPPDGLEAITAIRESGGLFVYASDREALLAQDKLGTYEGIYAEPSAAVALVGAEKLLTVREVGPQATIVIVVTGSGFRETGALSGQRELTRTSVDPVIGMEVVEGHLRR